jgi:hypothetical protein
MNEPLKSRFENFDFKDNRVIILFLKKMKYKKSS